MSLSFFSRAMGNWRTVGILVLAATVSCMEAQDSGAESATTLLLKDARVTPPGSERSKRDFPVTVRVGDEDLSTGLGEIGWKLPKTLAPGYYWVEFTGNAPTTPVEWMMPGGFEAEPHRIKTGRSAKDAKIVAFSFEVSEGRRQKVDRFRHLDLDIPITVTTRRSDHPVKLEQDGWLSIDSKWTYGLCGGVRLVPVKEMDLADLSVSTDEPFHLFDRVAPYFNVSVSPLGKEPFKGSLRWTWIDGLEGTLKTETKEISIPSGERFSTKTEIRPKYGIYTLQVELLDANGQTLLKQSRNCSYSSYVDNKSLPDNWPFAWHLRPFDPMIPAVGFKWLRVFSGWNELEPEQGKYDWAHMDAMMKTAREGGYKVLITFDGTPKWASRRPDLPKFPNPAQKIKTYWGYPPTDWQYYRNFMQAFWARYAPNGDAGVIAAIEVLNEPNAGHSTDYTYEEYTELCKISFEETHKLAPGVKVVGISQSGGLHMWWVNGVLDAGAGKWMDVASTHNYEISAPTGQVSVGSKDRLMREALDKRGFKSMPIWNTEVGVGSFSRMGGVIVPDTEIDERARKSPKFNPAQPQKVGKRWRSSNEWVGACDMVRSSAQNIDMGVSPNFYFKWQANSFSWVQDWKEDGNVTPKLMVPVQSVQSQLWLRYAMDGRDPIKLESPDKNYFLFAHRFYGPEGRLTVLYAHPKVGGIVVQDELSGDAPNAVKGEVVVPLEEGKRLSSLPGYNRKIFTISVPGVRDGAVLMDILAREQKAPERKSGVVRVDIARAPIYLIEPASGAKVWPEK